MMTHYFLKLISFILFSLFVYFISRFVGDAFLYIAGMAMGKLSYVWINGDEDP